jgi:predicted ArsR family transcriptional regulator
MLKRVEEHTKQIPQETRLIISALDNPIRQAILMLLTENKELTFTDMQKELNLEKLTLNFHLKKLFAAALIDHYYKHEVGNPKYSYYAVTPLGRRILTNLNNALTPPVNQQV